MLSSHYGSTRHKVAPIGRARTVTLSLETLSCFETVLRQFLCLVSVLQDGKRILRVSATYIV